ncbi:aquaporin [Aquabacter cavernae]|uniref:aquaporin n=1 Tax=Aquabacter cavernae TaxID=2496029 RepID=UPI000F8E077C|nr:MIP/aquaporin family protein [Aquabacter cavernae]
MTDATAAAIPTPRIRATPGLVRRLAAEAMGSALLLAIVVGSGIMGERLAGGTVALALLANTLATGAGLAVLITLLGPVSGAHFNPAVTLVFALRREIAPRRAAAYMAVQVVGAVLGVWLAHLMFGESPFQVSATMRGGAAQALSECVATFGLVVVILGTVHVRPEATAAMVGLYITSAYWFTASTSFANPAVTLARALTDTFAGIAPESVPVFILAQLGGAGLALVLSGWLFQQEEEGA